MSCKQFDAYCDTEIHYDPGYEFDVSDTPSRETPKGACSWTRKVIATHDASYTFLIGGKVKRLIAPRFVGD